MALTASAGESELHHSGEFEGLEYLRDLFSDHGSNNMKKRPLVAPFPSSARVHDWSELPRDITHLIADKMRFFPHLQKFSAASKEWRHISFEIIKTLSPKIRSGPPMLLLPYNHETQTATFFEIENSELYDLKVPELKNQRICGASNGWLAILDNNLDLFLFNTVTRSRIKLPHLHSSVIAEFHKLGCAYYEKFDVNEIWCRRLLIRKVALCGDPSSSNCLIAIICSYFSRPAVYRLGDEGWTIEVHEQRRGYIQIFFYQGKIFAVREGLYIDIYEYHKQDDLRLLKTIREPQNPELDPEWSVMIVKYLVEFSGDLFFIGAVSISGIWSHFEVYRFDPSSEKLMPWSRVYSLGDQSLFLGVNECICMSVKEFPWCKSNCIYFINDRMFTFYGYEWENGVFSLEENRVIARFDIEHPVPCRTEQAVWYRPNV